MFVNHEIAKADQIFSRAKVIKALYTYLRIMWYVKWFPSLSRPDRL